jgi:hypothetical protein
MEEEFIVDQHIDINELLLLVEKWDRIAQKAHDAYNREPNDKFIFASAVARTCSDDLKKLFKVTDSSSSSPIEA